MKYEDTTTPVDPEFILLHRFQNELHKDLAGYWARGVFQITHPNDHQVAASVLSDYLENSDQLVDNKRIWVLSPHTEGLYRLQMPGYFTTWKSHLTPEDLVPYLILGKPCIPGARIRYKSIDYVDFYEDSLSIN